MAASSHQTYLTPSKTPVKEIKYLSPQALHFCFVCQGSCDPSIRINLWKDGKLSKAGETIENIFHTKITHVDYQVLCKNCWRKIQTLEKKKTSIAEDISKGRKKVKNFVRCRFKRGQRDDSSGHHQHQSSRKRLSFYSKEATTKKDKTSNVEVNFLNYHFISVKWLPYFCRCLIIWRMDGCFQFT